MQYRNGEQTESMRLYTRKNAQPVQGCLNIIVQCFAAHIAHSCQQY